MESELMEKKKGEIIKERVHMSKGKHMHTWEIEK
jgi:hypothetical protein